MKVAISICLLVATAAAAPHYTRSTKLDTKLSDHVRLAEEAWTAAERERDPKQQLALWEAAAIAFDAIDAEPVDAKVKRESAYAAVLAWKNALAVDLKVKTPDPGEPKPQQLPAREQKLIAAIARYTNNADAIDADLPGLLFVEAMVYVRFEQLDTAAAKLLAVFDRFPHDDVAVHAATLVLDSYNRLHRFDELVAFAKRLAADDKLMRANPDLADLVHKIGTTSKRRELEQLEVTAKATHDLETYVAVGNGYLALYNANPDAVDGDELLYNVGVSFEAGRSMTAAIQAFETLQRKYPRSKISVRALARLGKIYGDLAMYAEAAHRYELYAKKFAGEKDAIDAISDAVLYRKALGDRAKTIADIDYLTRTFGAKKQSVIADAQWSLTALFEAEPDRAIAQLRTYLRSFATHGDPSRVVIAHAKIGQLLWKQSCSLPGVDGLCVKIDEHGPRTCGNGTVPTFVARPRDARKRADALAAFKTAIAEYERQGRHDDGAARYYYAQAKLALADDEVEAQLAIAFPRNLDFDPADAPLRTANMKRFTEWLDHEQRAGSRATRAYQEVLSIKDAASSITAASRFGVVSLSFASKLVTSEIPRDVSAGTLAIEKVTAYCGSMTEVSAPLVQHAVDAFGVCLAKSTELAWFSESSAVCERVLLALAPEAYPRMRELRAQPQPAPVIAVEPALP